jgi:hypothetical protein
MRGRQHEKQQPQQQFAGKISRQKVNNRHNAATRPRSYFRTILTLLFFVALVLVVLRDPEGPIGTWKKPNPEAILRSTVTWGLNRWYPNGNVSVVMPKGTFGGKNGLQMTVTCFGFIVSSRPRKKCLTAIHSTFILLISFSIERGH